MTICLASLAFATAASAYIYVAAAGSAVVQRTTLDGGGRSTVAATGLPAAGVALNATDFFWGVENGLNGWINRAQLPNGAGESTLVGDASFYGLAVNATHIFWTNPITSAVGRANLDGSLPNQALIPGLQSYPQWIAIDDTHVYWTNGANNIGRANLDGTGANENFIVTGASNLQGIAVNGSDIYWADFGDVNGGGSIGRATIAGTGITNDWLSTDTNPVAIAITPGDLYWSTFKLTGSGTSVGTVARARLDGSNKNESVATGLDRPRGVAVNLDPGMTQPAISSSAPASGTGGNPLNATAVLTGGSAPTGTITFNAYGPQSGAGTPNCIGPPAFQSTVSATAGPTDSGVFEPRAAGTYYWTAAYGGDSVNGPTSTLCGSGGKTTVTKSTPLISGTATSAAFGSAIRDQVTLSGGDPTGDVTFDVYGPDDANCAGLPVHTATGAIANGAASVNWTSYPSAGAYRWVASYAGDEAHNAVSTACGAPGQTSTVTKRSPTISASGGDTVALGDPASADATLSGAFTPSGAVTFVLFSNPDCTGAVQTAANRPLSGDTASSGPLLPTSAGTLYWVATYNGDEANNAATSGCAAQPLTVRPRVPMTVTTTGTGGGSVSSTPAGISCPGACSGEFKADAPVTLTATPAAGSTFDGWSGDCVGAGACTVTMSQARAVSATFTRGGDAAGAPDTRIDATKIKAKKGKARFTFSASGGSGALSFECALTKKKKKKGAAPKFKSCGSPESYKKLKKGKYRFHVRALDAAGQADASPASANFKSKRKRKR